MSVWWWRNGAEPSDRQVFQQTGSVIDEMRALAAELRALTADLDERAHKR